VSNKVANILLSLGKVDRKIIFAIIGIVVLIPLLKPEWVDIPIQISPDSRKVFTELSSLEPDSKVLLSFEYGPSTKPEIHPMSVALLNHLFAKQIKVYIMALWPDGVFMATDALDQVLSSKLFNVEEYNDYVNLGFKQGGEVVIRGVASDIRQLYTKDYKQVPMDDIPMMEGVNSVSDFDYVIDLSAGTPGTTEWVQYACDPKNVPFTSGCTSIQVTDVMPYVKSGQVRGILAGMPGAAEYESMVKEELQRLQKENSPGINPGVTVPTGKATGRMSAQSIAHLVMVLFIILGNISYFISRRMKARE
tara:strand:+ start:44 stop:961 length:918 start_codon:yes stop_codon:yes gene_type:complete